MEKQTEKNYLIKELTDSEIYAKYEETQKIHLKKYNNYGFWWIYVLKCENDFYYIGMSLNYRKRIKQHFEGIGSNFTKRIKPVSVVVIFCTHTKDRNIAYKIETATAKEYRENFGSHKVVGGKFLQLKKHEKNTNN